MTCILCLYQQNKLNYVVQVVENVSLFHLAVNAEKLRSAQKITTAWVSHHIAFGRHDRSTN